MKWITKGEGEGFRVLGRVRMSPTGRNTRLSVTPSLEPKCTCTLREREAPVARVGAVDGCLPHKAVARVTAVVHNHPSGKNLQVLAVVVSFVNIWR